MAPRPPACQAARVLPRPLLAFTLAAALALPSAGCSLTPGDRARLALGAATAAYNAANAGVTEAKAAAHERCLGPSTPPAAAPACVEGVVERWAGRAAAIEALHAALLDARLALGVVEALGAGGGAVPLDAWEQLDEAVRATVDAVRAVAGAAAGKAPSGGPAPAATTNGER